MPFHLHFLLQFSSLSLVACPGTGCSRQEKAVRPGIGDRTDDKGAHPRCSEQVSRLSEHVN